MLFKPLCPPGPPPSLILAKPGLISNSSWITRISSGLILKNPAKAPTALPLKFIKVVGKSNLTSWPSMVPRPVSPKYLGSSRRLILYLSARRRKRSTPALCLECSYSAPGLPRPTISLMVICHAFYVKINRRLCGDALYGLRF